MLVYDITNEKSFDNIKNWIRNIEEVCFNRTNMGKILNAIKSNLSHYNMYTHVNNMYTHVNNMYTHVNNMYTHVNNMYTHVNNMYTQLTTGLG